LDDDDDDDAPPRLFLLEARRRKKTGKKRRKELCLRTKFGFVCREKERRRLKEFLLRDGGVLHAVWKHDVLALAVADDFVRELRAVALDRAGVRLRSRWGRGGRGGRCDDDSDDVLERRQLFVQI